MWMTDTRSTRVSATVYHKHKYLTTPTVTDADRVLAAAQKLSEEIKGRMPQHLSATNLEVVEIGGAEVLGRASFDFFGELLGCCKHAVGGGDGRRGYLCL